MSFYFKHPLARVDYSVGWPEAFLEGRSIASSSWSVTPFENGGIVIETAAFEPARAVATLSGGRPGHVYSIANDVTFSDGRRDVRSIALRVEAR